MLATKQWEQLIILKYKRLPIIIVVTYYLERSNDKVVKVYMINFSYFRISASPF